mmetsp:Transcript_29521/g.39277  ORF Transcript_29521/g.39277 Transcript_29521/m.39277 type:complete len:103 (+) Transcript_29521:469-777(+)|eukprot:CAMPEP_0185590018 /NCGR_PEP_ID=MMETSP0434-20130131/59145_1 /TAXON_ID=626734 ORGANISM="Favella taraikaensis, Strain Fe Narragansett Bay" /NCGR_SAMPLE_ID=MMETSP0434 /ASSEMBLY_ACC=CAM_ASM_000379 /LENGTH=102 /DNA_ID=CAMNT_0028213857 /DNA_START=414 /DNA_END=722 /DNA_ORIENTATION=-
MQMFNEEKKKMKELLLDSQTDGNDLKAEVADMNEQMVLERERLEAQMEAMRSEEERVVEELKGELKEAVVEAGTYRQKFETTKEDLLKERSYADTTKKRFDS